MKAKNFVSADESRKIEDAVREAERGTSGEIVAAIVDSSSRYDWIGYRSALLGWLAASIFSTALHYYRPFALDFWSLFAMQAAGLIIGWAFSRNSWVLRFLVPEEVMAEEVLEAAQNSFLKHGLTNTRDRTGVLVFVSLREHRVQILADRGIHEKVGGESFWKAEADRIVAGIKSGEAGNGMAEAIRSIGEKLKVHFPRRGDDSNELSDRMRTE